jgi:hypothetical protein
MKKTLLLVLISLGCLIGCKTFPQFVEQQEAYERGDIAVFIEKESREGTRKGNVTLYELVLDSTIDKLHSTRFVHRKIVTLVLSDARKEYDTWNWFVLSHQKRFEEEYIKNMLAKAANAEFFSKDQSDYDLGKALSNGAVYQHKNGEKVVGVAQQSSFYTIIVFDNSVMPFSQTKIKAYIEQLCQSKEFLETDKRFRSFLREAFGDAERTSEVVRFFSDYFPEEAGLIRSFLWRSEKNHASETLSVSYKPLSHVGELWKVEATMTPGNKRFAISMSLGKDGLPASLEVEEKATY